MKFRKSGQALLAAAVSIGIGLGITSCGESNTIDYLFVTASKNNPGQIAVYRVDQESGALTQIPDSPYSFPGRNPVAEVTSPNGKSLYVAYHDDNTIVQYNIGSDGKLYPENTYQTPGTEPVALSINAAGTFLLAVDSFQPAPTGQPPYTDTNQGPGALVVYPISATGTLGTPVSNGNLPYWPLQFNPSSVNLPLKDNFVYVVNTNTAAQAGTISAFAIDPTSGVLTVINDPVTGGNVFPAGVSPTASASDPTSRFLYVTDTATNQLIAYGIQSTGVITPVQNGPFKTDVFPDAVTVDLSGQYIYVANYNSNDISAYTIDQGTGAPSSLATNTYPTKTGPTCVLIEPAFGRYLYTSNFLDSSITGYQLNPNSGLLTGTENNPYPTAGQPTCTAAVTHGNHASQHVQPESGNGA